MSQKKAWGLLDRKERWSLSRRGWLVFLLTVTGLSALFLFTIHPFLAVTSRVDSKFLVVEGWVHQYAIAVAAEEFRAGSYEKVFTTGGPIAGTGAFSNVYNTSASVGAGRLRNAGLDPDLVQMVPSKVTDRDRTYSSAVALRDWLNENKVNVTHLNVLTEDAHARRTRLLFQKAFGNQVKVGVISVANPDYDAKYWWRYSQGIKEIISEGAAYLYACLFFHP